MDGTLCTSRFPRPHYDPSFDGAKRIMDPCRVAQDKPRREILDLIEGKAWVVLTGRASWSLPITTVWLAHYSLSPGCILMRARGDDRPAPEVKAEWLASIEGPKTVIDDDDDMKLECLTWGAEFVDAKGIYAQ